MSKSLGKELKILVGNHENLEKEKSIKIDRMIPTDQLKKEMAFGSVLYEIEFGINLRKKANEGETKYEMKFFDSDICSFIQTKLPKRENGINLEFKHGTKVVYKHEDESGCYHSYAKEQIVMDYTKCFIRFSWDKKKNKI